MVVSMKFMQLTIDLLIYPESRLYHDFYMFYVLLNTYCHSYLTFS
jgi:hypothetical protein